MKTWPDIFFSLLLLPLQIKACETNMQTTFQMKVNFGGSLSKLHTSRTALQTVCVITVNVYMSAYVRVAIYQKSKLNERIYEDTHTFQICTCAKACQNPCSSKLTPMDPSLSNSTPMELLNVSAISVLRKLGMKMTQVNAHMATADHDRQGQAAHRWYKSCTVVKFTSGKAHA